MQDEILDEQEMIPYADGKLSWMSPAPGPHEKYLEHIVGSRKCPTKEILNCTQGTPNPDRPGQETEERQAIYNHNKIYFNVLEMFLVL